MFWLARPPFLQRVAAGLIVVAVLFFELRPPPTEPRPFAAVDLTAGTALEPESIDWRHVVVGVLADFQPTGVLLVDVGAGEPLTRAMLGLAPAIPPGWWALEVPLPSGTAPGTEVRLVVDVRRAPRVVPGLVVETTNDGSFEGSTGLVAIPESEAGAASAALADASLTVLVGGADG